MLVVIEKVNKVTAAVLLIGGCICAFSGLVAAQEPVEESAVVSMVAKELTPEDIPSLLYQDWEYVSLRDAIAARLLVDPNSDEAVEAEVEILSAQELEAAEKAARAAAAATIIDEDLEPIDPGIRILKLNGIVYVAQDDWTIWFNQQRITPNSVLPEEVTSLRVDREFIEITWLDNYRNSVFPIRLRPHQRFDLDTRIFLPGQD